VELHSVVDHQAVVDHSAVDHQAVVDHSAVVHQAAVAHSEAALAAVSLLAALILVLLQPTHNPATGHLARNKRLDVISLTKIRSYCAL
jgi:hypothetical protein